MNADFKDEKEGKAHRLRSEVQFDTTSPRIVDTEYVIVGVHPWQRSKLWLDHWRSPMRIERESAKIRLSEEMK
jgi:siderophore synthetase component